MKEFIIYTRTTEEIVKADWWEINNGLVIFKNRDFDMLAVFNMNNIDGFKEKL